MKTVSSDQEFQFKDGDEVRDYRFNKRLFVSINRRNETYPVVCYDEDGEQWAIYTLDGRLSSHHDNPSLVLVDRPIKKVKKTYWFVSNKARFDHTNGKSLRCASFLYSSKDECIREAYKFNENALDVQLHSIEIEVEE